MLDVASNATSGNEGLAETTKDRKTWIEEKLEKLKAMEKLRTEAADRERQTRTDNPRSTNTRIEDNLKQLRIMEKLRSLMDGDYYNTPGG